MSDPQFAAGREYENIKIGSHKTEGKMCRNVRSDVEGTQDLPLPHFY